MSPHKFIFVVGATATGKSSWALKEAQTHQACIINCDSIQVYTHVQIGANKPTTEELKLVPHHLISYVQPPRECTAGEYTRDFWHLVEKEKTRNIKLVVGGTGFYFQALEKGMFEVSPVKEDILLAVREQLKTEPGARLLYEEMIRRDPNLENKIFPNDHYRIERSVSLMRSENRTITEIQNEKKEKTQAFPYPLLKIGLWQERDELRKVVTERTKKMIKEGLIEEVESLLRVGYRDWSPLRSVGYQEVIEYLENNQSQDWLVEGICKNTMNLAKRQVTWFKRDKDIFWIKDAKDAEQARQKTQKFVE